MEQTRSNIIVRTNFQGVHKYPAASGAERYLKEYHRHLFGVRVEIQVFNDDRELEFIALKRDIENWLTEQMDQDNVWHMVTLSCEQVAKLLLGHLLDVLPTPNDRRIEVYIDEDGENGASVLKYGPDPSVPRKNIKMMGVYEKYPTAHPDDDIGIDWYQQQAYFAIQEHEDEKDEAMHWATKIGEETGELLGVISHKYYGGSYDESELVDELGDVLWAASALANLFNVSMSKVAETNILKLKKRFPTGEFDPERSARRHQIDKGE